MKSLIFNMGLRIHLNGIHKICGELGIKQNLTQLHTLNQNGVFEWKNQSFWSELKKCFSLTNFQINFRYK